MQDSGSPAPGQPEVPHPPYEELRSALGDRADGTSSVDALQAELHAERPDPAEVARHASKLRAIPELEARIANWWDDPNTQRWVLWLTDAGL